MNKYLDKLTKDDFKDFLKMFCIDDIRDYDIKTNFVDGISAADYLEIIGRRKGSDEKFKVLPQNQINAFKLKLTDFSAKLIVVTTENEARDINKLYLFEMSKKFGKNYFFDLMAREHSMPNYDSKSPYETDREIADTIEYFFNMDKKKRAYDKIFE